MLVNESTRDSKPEREGERFRSQSPFEHSLQAEPPDSDVVGARLLGAERASYSQGDCPRAEDVGITRRCDPLPIRDPRCAGAQLQRELMGLEHDLAPLACHLLLGSRSK